MNVQVPMTWRPTRGALRSEDKLRERQTRAAARALPPGMGRNTDLLADIAEGHYFAGGGNRAHRLDDIWVCWSGYGCNQGTFRRAARVTFSG